VLFGPSGSGKSSLLGAGLIPRLRQEIAVHACPAALRILTPGPTAAATYGHLLRPAPGEPESWVVVDQFEKIFTLRHDRRERSRFIDLLLAARDPGSGLRVLVAVRADFYARCAERRGLAERLVRRRAAARPDDGRRAARGAGGHRPASWICCTWPTSRASSAFAGTAFAASRRAATATMAAPRPRA
jgi:hypothetical protein